jgi:hypothetical protein
VGDVDLKTYITIYYKGIFGPPVENNFTLVEDQNQDIPQETVEENNILTSPFIEEGRRGSVADET